MPWGFKQRQTVYRARLTATSHDLQWRRRATEDEEALDTCLAGFVAPMTIKPNMTFSTLTIVFSYQSVALDIQPRRYKAQPSHNRARQQQQVRPCRFQHALGPLLFTHKSVLSGFERSWLLLTLLLLRPLLRLQALQQPLFTRYQPFLHHHQAFQRLGAALGGQAQSPRGSTDSGASSFCCCCRAGGYRFSKTNMLL